MATLIGVLPEKYSPLLPNGNGLQSVYLTEVGTEFATALFRMIGAEANVARDATQAVETVDPLKIAPEASIEEWERRVEKSIRDTPKLQETEKLSLIQARRGQGIFRANVQSIETRCRVTRVDRPEHLIASHAKPWRDSTNEERLAGENGLLLTPTIDHLFDKGFIAFEGSGRLLISPVAHQPSLVRMGIRVDEPLNVGEFSQVQRQFLEYHRENVFRMAQRGR
jgi:hypothetical protein